ncbi:purine-nucleoside phosphorylase [Aminivibrio sp.]
MKNKVSDGIAFLSSLVKNPPAALVVLGSGLGSFADSLEEKIVIPYGDIPHWPVSTAPGHAGRLVLGSLDGMPLAVMQGRVHYYEGYSMEELIYPVRVFGQWGTKIYMATNAVGGVDQALSPGDLVLLTDHINFMGVNPLRGPDTPDWNPRFPDMTTCYSEALAAAAERAAGELSIPLKKGVYIAFSGPSFETPAEIRMARTLGASVVGMSTVPEVIAANAMGMKVCAVSCVANYAAGITCDPLSGDEVIREMGKASGKLVSLLRGFFREVSRTNV